MLTHVATGDRRGSTYLLILSVLAGILLRILLLGSKSLWLDEARSLLVAQAGQNAIWIGRGEVYHPPLYYLLLAQWMQLGYDEFTLRLSSALLGCVAIYLVYAFVKTLGSDEVALSAAWLVALSPLLVWYSQELRSYSLLAALGLAALWALAKLLVQPRLGWWLLFVAAMSAALYTHYNAVLLLPAQLAVAAVLMAQERAQRRAVAFWLAAWPVILLLYIPWLRSPAFRTFLKLSQRSELYGPKLLADVLGIDPSLAGGIILAALAGFAVAGVAAGAVVILRRYDLSYWQRLPQSRLLRSIMLIGFLLVLIAAVYPRGYTMKRLLVVLWPFALVIVAWFWPWRARVRGGLGLMLAASLLAALANVILIPKDPWREIAAYIAAHRQPGDAIWILPSYHNAPFNYYYSGDVSTGVDARAYQAMGDKKLEALLREHPRVWLVQHTVDSRDVDPTRRVNHWLSTHLQLAKTHHLRQIELTLFEHSP